MKNCSIVKEVIERYKENELIMASKLYKEELSGKISEAAYYKTLQRMCEARELVNIAKGTYHIPKMSKYGIVPPSEKDIIAAYTENNKGTVIGYTLYNNLNLTTQVSKTITIMSSALESMTKSIRNIVIQQVPLEFSKDITNMVQGLEVLQNFNTIQDINYSEFIKFTESLASSFNSNAFETVTSVKKYKKSTISFLREILDYYGIKHNLNKYLSALSQYKHPKIAELYRITQYHKTNNYL